MDEKTISDRTTGVAAAERQRGFGGATPLELFLGGTTAALEGMQPS